MKRFLALSLSALMICGALTACGGSNSETPAPAETTAPAKTEATTEAAKSDSAEKTENTEKPEKPSKREAKPSTQGFTFADLQDNYAILSELYDTVEAAYNDDSIAQSDEVEANLTEAKDLIDQMGELTEADFADEKDLLEMNDAIYDMCEALGAIVDQMEEAPADTETSDASEEITFEDLQEAYAELVDDYNTVKDAVEGGVITLTDEQTEVVNEAADLINDLGEISEDDFESQDDINTIGATIVNIDAGLAAIVEAAS